MDERTELTIAYVQHKAEEQSAVIEARDAVAAAAGRADALLSGMLSALPIYDATDADFRAQLKQAARMGAINDVLGFRP
jgi:alkanesulfonate monooxygenase SsuD/methylene tetrahydromethanopterin reductase-like flavin-dependent oxidoreductase (luciferase family)